MLFYILIIQYIILLFLCIVALRGAWRIKSLIALPRGMSRVRSSSPAPFLSRDKMPLQGGIPQKKKPQKTIWGWVIIFFGITYFFNFSDHAVLSGKLYEKVPR